MAEYLCEEDAEKIGGNPQSDRHAERCRQLAEWLKELKELREIIDACNILAVDGFAIIRLCKELKEAKRLLKMAVEDFSNIYDHIFYCDGMCDTCPIHGNRDTCDKWVHADEALKLIGDESSGV